MGTAKGIARRLLWAAIAMASGELGCGEGASSPASCVPGRTTACACDGGGQGLQTCLSDGTGYDVCSACRVERKGFTDATKSLGLPGNAGPCLAFEDFDGDGAIDLLLSPLEGTGAIAPSTAKVFRGGAAGTFAKQPAAELAKGFSVQCVTGDVDRDGKVDIVLGMVDARGRATVEYWHNAGGLVFERLADKVDVPYLAGPLIFAVGLWDYDQDGWLDLFVGRFYGGGNTGNGTPPACQFLSEADYACVLPMATNYPEPAIYHNETGTFKLKLGVLPPPFPGTTNAVGFADINRDGRIDVFMSNDWYVNHLHYQDAKGLYRHAEEGAGIAQYNHGMGVAITDFDNDGLLDMYGADLGPNNFWFGQADGTMKNRALELGIAAATHYHSNWAPLGEDFDLDGRADVFVASAGVVNNDADLAKLGLLQPVADHIPQYDLLFWNDGVGFSSQQLPHRPGQTANVVIGAAAAADPDGDGDLDILVAAGSPLQFRYLRNDQPAGNYLVVDVEGTTSNKDGIGAEVALIEGGKVSQLRVVGSQGSLGQSWRRAHFGLGTRTSVEGIEVRWPSGTTQLVGAVQANQTITITEE